MQKSICFSFIISLLTINCCSINAQQEKGQISVNIGVGYSPEFDGDIETPNSKFNLFNDPNLFNSSYPIAIKPMFKNHWVCSPITPNIGVMVDYGIISRLSLGIAVSYQREDIYTFSSIYYDIITRLNIAARFLYHSSRKNNRFDRYIGIRIGCSYWTDVPPAVSSFYPNLKPEYFINSPDILVPSFQVLYGVRTYILPDVAINIEVGLGSPYLIEGGLTFKINTHKNKDAQGALPTK